MPKIIKLTREQEARFPEFVDKWIKIGLSTAPADRERAERAIKGLYTLAKLKEPRVIWLPCPLSGALSAVLYAGVMAQHRLTGERSEPVSVYGAVGGAVGDAVRGAVYGAVGGAVGDAVGDAVRDAVGDAVGGAVRDAVGDAVYGAVYDAVGGAVRDAVGDAVYGAVYGAVGGAVGDAVGDAVRDAVGDAVGDAVRDAVGDAVRGAHDRQITQAVREAMRRAGFAWFGGSLWSAGYSAWADYFNEVLGVALDRNYFDATEACGFFWTLDDICFASERPTHINRDDRGRLHCEVGQSIGYRSGWGLWHWHGVRVPQFVVERPREISIERIDAESNAEVRRVMIERYRPDAEVSGAGAYLIESGSKRLDHDDGFGTLWRRELPDDEPLVMLEVINSTPEPDGHHKHYFLRVPPDMAKAHDAAAWTFGKTAAEYAPRIET